MQPIDVSELDHIVADVVYTAAVDGPARVRVFPPSSGRKSERPRREKVPVPVYDCRPIAPRLTLDEAGFQLLTHRSMFNDYYDSQRVEHEYYPEAAAVLKAATGAEAVFVFDHNVRNRQRADRGQQGVREPVEGAHNDYTLSSGPRRIREVLEQNDALHFASQRAALINLWRPIIGPVLDHPLAVCHARATAPEDFIPTEIQHFLEDNLETPHLTGEIYSFQHSPRHRWFYAPEMQTDEVMLLKCFDLADDGRACFTGHTGFRNPECPADSRSRESIEVRTVVVYPPGD